MRTFRNIEKIGLCAGVIGLLLAACLLAVAQNQRETLEAVAYGTSTQLGRTFNVTLIIESYSTPEDQQVLLDALLKGGQQAVSDALEKMPARGRISMPGTLGYEIKYIRTWPTPTGRHLRMLTNRTIAIGEARRSTRSRDYSMSALDLEVDNDMNKSSGTLMPACEVKINKQNEIEVETFQNPWRLGNFIDWNK